MNSAILETKMVQINSDFLLTRINNRCQNSGQHQQIHDKSRECKDKVVVGMVLQHAIEEMMMRYNGRWIVGKVEDE